MQRGAHSFDFQAQGGGGNVPFESSSPDHSLQEACSAHDGLEGAGWGARRRGEGCGRGEGVSRGAVSRRGRIESLDESPARHNIGTPLTVPNAFFFSFSLFFGLESSYGSGAYSSFENGGNTDLVIICLPL